MTTIQDHLAAWGVPERYRDDFNSTLMQCAPYVSLASAVARAANWYPEQDAVLVEMICNHDTAALREWSDSDAWASIATETGDDDGVADYVSAVRVAFSALIHAIS